MNVPFMFNWCNSIRQQADVYFIITTQHNQNHRVTQNFVAHSRSTKSENNIDSKIKFLKTRKYHYNMEIKLPSITQTRNSKIFN